MRTTKTHNQTQQSELVKLSPFLKKHSKKPPTSPIRCARRYTNMIKLLVTLLIFTSSISFASGDEFDILVNDFKETAENQYQFEFTQLSQPYGKDHLKNEDFIIKLRYKCTKLICNSKILHKKGYLTAIKLLKKQAVKGHKIKFGIMGGGYKHITENIYQSNALNVYDNVVYSFEHQ